MTLVRESESWDEPEQVASGVGLPQGWSEVTLDQILLSLESGSRPTGGVRGIKVGVPSIGGEHLNNGGGFRFENIKYIPHTFYRRMNRGDIRTGDVLIVKDGATTGKVALVRQDFPYDPAVVNEHVFVCRPEPTIHPPFLFYFLFSREGQARLMENFRGSAQGGINQSFARGTLVPIAPPPEQKRIVERIEQLLARVHAAHNCLARVPAILKRFRQAVLSNACSGRLTADWRYRQPSDQPDIQSLLDTIRSAPKRKKSQKSRDAASDLPDLPEIPSSWKWISFGELLSRLRSGSTEVPRNEPTEFPILRSSSVRPQFIDLKDVRFLTVEQSKNEENYLSDGDLVFTRLSGSLEFVANCALVSGLNGRRIQYPDRLFCAKLAEPKSAAYCELAFANPSLREFLIIESKSSAGHQRISMGTLTGFPIPLPPLAEQHEIVRRVDAVFKLAEAIEKRVAAAAARAEKLMQTILAKAFRGELVLTEVELARREGRSYEPASALLARIRGERGSAERRLPSHSEGRPVRSRRPSHRSA